MDAKIKHHGVVESVEPGCVHVRIRQSDGCAACRVASHCHSAEAQDKIIDVGDSSGRYHAGDSVVVLADRSVGFTAGLYAYVLRRLGGSLGTGCACSLLSGGLATA